MKNKKPFPYFLNCLSGTAAKLTAHVAKTALAAVLLMGLARQAGAGTYSLSNDWTVANGVNDIATGDVNRGMGYSVVSNQVFVANKGVPAIDVFDGVAGTFVGNVSVGWTAGGNFKIDQVVGADDGAIYACNLQTAPTGTAQFKIYRWANWADTNQVTAYAGDPTYGASLPSKRIGDTMTITGAGTSTLILAGFNNTTNMALFSTLDGTNFTPTVVHIAGLSAPGGGVSYGLAFYTNNTFLFKPNGGTSLYLIQYPANFAGQQSVTATVLGSTPLSGNFVVISYDPASKLLATHAAAVATVNLFSLPSFGSGLSSVGSIAFPVPNGNGNETAGIALGGTGRTNVIYALDTNNGLQASLINYIPAAVAPTITTQPTGGTIYTNDPSFVLQVTASGSVPFSYQWQLNSNNVAGATNAAYTLAFPTTSQGGYYDVIVTNGGGSITSSPVLVNVITPITSTVVTQLWSAAAGSRPYLGTGDYNTRGIAYDTNTSKLLVSDHANTTIYVLDANTGSDLFTMNTAGIAGGTFPLDQVGVADDGVVYAGNLAITGSGDAFSLFSWSSVDSNAVPTQAFGPADPGAGSGDRWGDTLAVRGAGANTQILLGSYNSANVVLFTTQDGLTFTPTLITVAGAPAGFSSVGIAFGAGNTFWAKGGHNFDLRQVSFDPTSATGTILLDYVAPTQIPNDLAGLAVDVTNNILAGVNFNDAPNDLQLYQLSGNTNSPVLFDQTFFATANGNIQDNAQVALKFPRAYAIDVNNGIVALTYGVPLAQLPTYTITAETLQAGPGVMLTWDSVASHVYQVQYKTSLADVSWTNAGSPITATGTTTSYTDSVTGVKTRFYRIQGQ